MVNDKFTKFRNSLKKEQRELLDRLFKQHSDECQKAIKDEITTDKRHSTILNMCAYAFSESGPLAKTGYHFIKVEPLYKYRDEKGNKIFDLVLYNKEQKRAILIECKSSIGDARSVLNDLKDQMVHVQKHKTELEEEIGGEVSDFEFVICSIPQDIEDVGKSLKDEPVCLWSADLFFFTMKLHNHSGSTSGDKTAPLIKKRQLHIDEKLRTELYKKIESRGQIEGTKITPSSHFCRILSRVFVKITQQVMYRSAGEEKRFWLNELTHVVQEELQGIEQEDIIRISEEIYKRALDLKIISVEQEKHEPHDIEFGLKIASRNSRIVEEKIEENYIETKCKDSSPTKAMEEYAQYVKQSKGSLDQHF